METLVALSILMIGISAAFSVAQVGISSSTFAKDRITAFFLAQEAFEAVKSVRDHNLLVQNSGTNTRWVLGLTQRDLIQMNSGPCYRPGGEPCDYDFSASLMAGTDIFTTCSEMANGCNLRSIDLPNSQLSYYGYSAGTPSKFTRHVYIEEVVGDSEAIVTVVVTWGSHSFETVSHIYNWF